MFSKWFNQNIFEMNWSKCFRNDLLNRNIFEMNQLKYFQNDLIEILGNELIEIISNIEMKKI